MIVRKWPAAFRAKYGGEWPNTYLCFDTETTGFSSEQDWIIQLGFVLVEGGKPIDRRRHDIDWTKAGVPLEAIHTRMDNTRRHMQKNGKIYPFTAKGLQETGHHPAKVLNFYAKLFNDVFARKIPVVGHNILGFDVSAFLVNCGKVEGVEACRFGDDAVIDTYPIEKASQAMDEPRFAVRKEDTLRSYLLRLHHTKLPKIYASLDEHCAAKYDFASHGLPPEEMHTADGDAFGAHLLMEAYRRQLANSLPLPAGPSGFPEKPRPAGQPGKKRYRGMRIA